ncbi:MAG: hypothetical protein HQL56_18335 [Magnetococcales bacterium]|nr:hypothetical protein [Magnetococcales bacterium]
MEHPLVKLLGVGSTLLLASTYGGDDLRVPTVENTFRGVRNLEIMRRSIQGETPRQLAKEYCLTPRRVYAILYGSI